MSRFDNLSKIRQMLTSMRPSIGSWIQLPNASVAEIMGNAGYDWIAIDAEHGTISIESFPHLFRAIELSGAVPLVRILEPSISRCREALDSGAGGVIMPMIESAKQLTELISNCRWPPAGVRGVGFCRANLYGKRFDDYSEEAKSPLVVAMIETKKGIQNISEIASVEGLDAVLIGPYDLTASLGILGEFDSPLFEKAISTVKFECSKNSVACGVHIVSPSKKNLQKRIDEGYTFIAYGIDAVFLNDSCQNPNINS